MTDEEFAVVAELTARVNALDFVLHSIILELGDRNPGCRDDLRERVERCAAQLKDVDDPGADMRRKTIEYARAMLAP
ncbi:hypothetical protein [Methylobacterium oryzihabitans]|uniref:Uncharacterized protein n=1 Tax=Methylobacterium oryzihabitans TaxID=2499852 RepID=A0A437PD60_9HYPH|nr:hypothetical protein [Methylobacterium oryzihabitans]RVU20207.1 hypothetical protein EOE48_06255 [Methylobacterium oryzihabitans]